MVVKNFVFRQDLVGRKVVTGMKKTFFAILDPTCTHIYFGPKKPK